MENIDKAVDFGNPEALEAELSAVEAPVEEAKPKAKRKRKPVMITCPECGHVFERPHVKRGVLSGIKVEDMTEDQLKIEYRNARSVHYKQTKAKGKATDKAQERLDKVIAIMEEQGIAPGTRKAAAPVDAGDIANLIKAGKVSVEDIQALLDSVDEDTE